MNPFIFFRVIALIILLTSCRSGEIACPRVKSAKLNKRPFNYMKQTQKYASVKEVEKEKPKRVEFKTNKHAKSAENIEEWDCPKPGTKTALPKSVKENIKRNRKKIEGYYKSRIKSDTIQSIPG